LPKRKVKKEEWSLEESKQDAMRLKKILGKGTLLQICDWCGRWAVVEPKGPKLHHLCEYDPARLRAMRKIPDPNQGSLL
jgi:hypothetical protein